MLVLLRKCINSRRVKLLISVFVLILRNALFACACVMIRMCATPSSSCVNGRLSIISALPMLCASRRRDLTDVISTPATLPTIRAVPCSHPAGRAAVAADVPADKPRPERYRRVRAIFTRLFVPLSGRKGGFRRAGEGKGTSAGKPL